VYGIVPDPRYIRSVLAWLAPGVTLMTDVSPADWVVERLRSWDPDGARLESFAPDGFEAYARLFHPAGNRPSHRGALGPSTAMKWADMARAKGITLSPDTTFSEVSGFGPNDQLDELAPMAGELPPETCDALSTVLRPHTRTPDRCWFCLWDGNGSFWSQSHAPLLPPGATRDETDQYWATARAQDGILGSTPRVKTHARRYFLFRGPLDAACTFEPSGWYTSPNLWWPDDRAWIVVTEIDGFSTYVGGTRALLQDALASPDVETIEVTLKTHMDPESSRPSWR
jgi:hypothetical protein